MMISHYYFHIACTKCITHSVYCKYSIYKCSTEGMDKQRKLTLFFIRKKIYFMLALVGWAKQFMLKRGKYNY